ncbi:hypothetical protein, partial [Bradyrhizobium sp. Ai1a-2]|uniref:hypothetical protein n=1 Tax=Bradyrhizobium sp. Ai1a-2 TaxID=196490 RepID=UPI0005BC44F1
SAVKVPKLRTGSGARSALTAAMCIVAPTSMAPAFGCTIGILPPFLDFDLLGFIYPILLLTAAEGLGCAIGQIPKRDRRMASSLSSAQQPMDQVF